MPVFGRPDPPFSSMPSTVMSQTQQQSQTQMQMVLDLQSKIDEQLRNLKPGDQRHTFLEKVKSALAAVTDYVGLLKLCTTAAKAAGLTLEAVIELLKQMV